MWSMRYRAPRRGGSVCTFCACAGWPLATNPAPAATPASAAVWVRNRLRLEFMIDLPKSRMFWFELLLGTDVLTDQPEVYRKIVTMNRTGPDTFRCLTPIVPCR